MRLSPRLALAAQMCAGAQSLIEIGCDHAQLSARVVQSGTCGALACDLRQGPLARAAATVHENGLESKIELRLSDGLKAISPDEGDTIAICGMGGELIAGILERSPWALAGAHRLVLQPQSKGAYLREFLAQSGCGIEHEALVRDGGKLYCVMLARGGLEPLGARQMYMFTEKMMGDPLLGVFLREQIAKREKIIEGKRLGGLDFSQDKEILKMLENHLYAT